MGFFGTQSHVEWECGVRLARLGRSPKARVTDAAAPVTPPARKGRSNGETVMDAVVKPWPKATLSDHVWEAAPALPRPSREEAEAAVRTLIAFTGDRPDREGLLD